MNGITKALAVAAAFFAALVFTVPATAASDEVEVFDVRFGIGASGRTRIVLDLSADPHYHAFLEKDQAGAKSLVIDIDGAAFDIGGRVAGSGEGTGHIGDYAYRMNDDGLASLSFDIARTSVPQAVFLIEPKDDAAHYRLVIDMTDASEAAFEKHLVEDYGPMRGGERLKRVIQGRPASAASEAGASGVATPVAGPNEHSGSNESDSLETDALDTDALASAAAGRAKAYAELDRLPVPRVKPQLLARKPAPGSTEARLNGRKVIIDAGHGGRDPGAIGQGGNYEKTVTLASARALRDILIKRGYEVVMTRDSDVKIELEDRMPRLSKEAADLFISIHADSIANADVRGASVYTLSKKGDLRLANQVNRAVKNGDGVIGNVDLTTLDSDISQIVADLSMSRVQEQSSTVADHLIRRLDGKVPMVNNTHREEDLMVLLTPDIPAVLLELGFMSNIHDEANLVREEWRKGAMTYVADAIDDYMATLPPVRHAALSDGAR